MLWARNQTRASPVPAHPYAASLVSRGRRKEETLWVDAPPPTPGSNWLRRAPAEGLELVAIGPVEGHQGQNAPGASKTMPLLASCPGKVYSKQATRADYGARLPGLESQLRPSLAVHLGRVRFPVGTAHL